MKSNGQWIASVALLLSASPSHAATTEYQYDALARLRRVVNDNGVVTDYTLDAAGNRTQVADVQPVLPSAPPSLTVPQASVLGTFGLSWTAAAGQVTRYELEESTSAAFAATQQVFAGDARSLTVRDRASGTYYYRVRACGTPGCSPYTPGSNAVVVTALTPLPPAPQNARAMFVATCVWRATWDAVAGAASYRVRETAGVERMVNGLQADIVCPFNNQNGNKPDWVRACDAASLCGPAARF